MPAKYNVTGWRQADTQTRGRHAAVRSTCWGGQPLPLACYFADQGQAGDQIKVLVLGELGPGAREQHEGLCANTHTCNRGQGQVGWSVCRTRSETGVKALRALGKGALEAVFLEKTSRCGMITTSYTTANEEPSYMEGQTFLFSSFWLLVSKTQFKFLFFLEHLNERI